MTPSSRLDRQIAEIVASLNAVDVPFALIGGLALASHRVIRATQDVDLLVDIEHGDRADAAIGALGYSQLHRSHEAANYQRGDERLDILFASRPAARRLLVHSQARQTSLGELRVVSAEGLIGFKLQAMANDASRTQDLEDIRALIRSNRATLDMEEVRQYFRLFDRERLLDELIG
jgi:hypothetical protein